MVFFGVFPGIAGCGVRPIGTVKPVCSQARSRLCILYPYGRAASAGSWRASQKTFRRCGGLAI